MALAGSPATTSIVASLPREKRGVASAVNDISRELGGPLGIAVLGSILNTAYRTALSDHTTSLSRPRSLTRPRLAGGRTGDRPAVGAKRSGGAKANPADVRAGSLALLAGSRATLARRSRLRRPSGARPRRVGGQRGPGRPCGARGPDRDGRETLASLSQPRRSRPFSRAEPDRARAAKCPPGSTV